jgi:hypothetical protein
MGIDFNSDLAIWRNPDPDENFKKFLHFILLEDPDLQPNMVVTALRKKFPSSTILSRILLFFW